jgi:hypothetical protein
LKIKSFYEQTLSAWHSIGLALANALLGNYNKSLCLNN